MSGEKQIEEMVEFLNNKINVERNSYFGKGCITIPIIEADKILNILQNYRKQSEWISVEDRLPETSIDDEVIICTTDGEVGAARFTRRLGKGQFDWISNEGSDFYDGDNVARVTHWMPLPEAPKKGGEEK